MRVGACMDNNIVEDNFQKISCNILIHDAIVLWYKNPNKSFMDCFKYTMSCRGFMWEENDKILDLDPTRTLIKVIDALNTTIIAQIVCYAFEIAKESKDRDESRCSFKSKKNIIVSEDIESDFQLLNFIRNAISHNDDFKEKVQYSFSQNERFLTFTSNREGKENSKVIIGKHELVCFLSDYILSFNDLNGFSIKPEINLDKVYSNEAIDKVEEFIGLRSKANGELLIPDENQISVLKNIVEYLRGHKVESLKCVEYRYPYKQNVFNNYLRAYDFYYLITGIYRNRYSTYSQYMKFLINFGTYYDMADIVQKQDIAGMFIINRMFQSFSSSSTKDLDNFSKLFDYNSFNKIRNSIMHGTYYKDFEGNFYFYDAPRGKKTEEKLKCIDKLSIEKFREMDRSISFSKAIEYDQRLTDQERYKKMIKTLKKKAGIK